MDLPSQYVPIEYVAAGFTFLGSAVAAMWVWLVSTMKRTEARLEDCLKRDLVIQSKWSELEGKYAATKALHDEVLVLVSKNLKD